MHACGHILGWLLVRNTCHHSQVRLRSRSGAAFCLFPPTCLIAFVLSEQKSFGACDAEFMKKGNYCLYTCGRCPSGGQEEKGEKKVRACGCGKYGGAN